MNEDFRDTSSHWLRWKRGFLVVGAHAMAVHGYPRATVDIDIWIEPTTANSHLVWRALADFGAPLDDRG